MAFEMSLLDIIALAERNRMTAREVARKLIVLWNSQQFPPDSLSGNNYVVPARFEPASQLPQKTDFIFDSTSGFFVAHGGSASIYNLSVRWLNPSSFERYQTDDQFQTLEKRVFHSQQGREDLTTIMLGRVPSWEANFMHRWYNSPAIVADSVYIYVEAGQLRQPAILVPIRGNRYILSDNKPIVISSDSFAHVPESAPIRQKFKEEIRILVPRSLFYI